MASFKFIIVSSQILGLFPFVHRKQEVFEESKSLLIYTKFTAMFCILSEVYVVYCESSKIETIADEQSTKTILALSNVSTLFSCLMVFHLVLRKRETFCFWLNEIGHLFSIVRNTKKLTRYYNSAFFMSFLFAVTGAGCEFYAAYFINTKADKWDVFGKPAVLAISNYLVMLQIKMFVQMLLLLVNFLRLYYQETNARLKSGEKSNDRQFWLGHLRELRFKDLEIKDLVEFLHSFFVPVVSLQLLWGFFTALLMAIFFTKLLITPLVQLWTLVYIFWDVFFIVGLCDAAEKEADKMAHHLHSLFIAWDDKEIKKEIDILSLQLLHRRLEFNALGFHKINFSLIYWMVGLLASYIVVVVQFRVDPNKELHSWEETIRNGSLF